MHSDSTSCCGLQSLSGSFDSSNSSTTTTTATTNPFQMQKGPFAPASAAAHPPHHHPSLGQMYVAAVESQVCGACSRKTKNPQGTCSRRCAWAVEGRCPQCGRDGSVPSHPDGPPSQQFCSITCASQSAQANWCPSCAVRQILPGSTHCSRECAAAAPSNVPVKPRLRTMLHNSALPHELLPHTDRQRQALVAAFQPKLAALGFVAVDVVRVAPHTLRRKAYLSYRSQVEAELAAIARCDGCMAKYGHGGEGNELKRFVPLSAKCVLQATATIAPATAFPSSSSQQQKSGGGRGAPLASFVTPCEDPSCGVCATLRHGFVLADYGEEQLSSHYSTSDQAAAAVWCAPEASPCGLAAIAIARVVVGNPNLVASADEIGIPDPAAREHSVIVTNGVESEDGTYVFCDEAMDPQYIVLIARAEEKY